MSSMTSAAPDVSESEVLTGAELYLHLLEQNTSQLARAADKIVEYTTLKATLKDLPQRCRRPLLAPVASGLAYFAAEVESTNNVLVLLGDGWFAERSAGQAAAIAQRRLEFLRREHQVLAEEQRTLRGRQDIFLGELPGAAEAVGKMTKTNNSGRGGNTSTAASSNGLDGGLGEGGSSTDGNGNDENDDELATFDEQDELTEEELITLEEELADRIDDDTYVEKVITERMIAKKELRVQAELARRQQFQQFQLKQQQRQQQQQEEDKGGNAAPPSPTAFRTPGDIFTATTTSTAASTVTVAVGEAKEDTAPAPVASPVQPTPTESMPSSPSKEKRVSFSPILDIRAAESTATAAAAVSATAPLPSSDQQQQPAVSRVTYAVGELVEREESGHPAPPLVPAVPSGGKKRRSLFQREMDGDDG